MLGAYTRGLIFGKGESIKERIRRQRARYTLLQMSIGDKEKSARNLYPTNRYARYGVSTRAAVAARICSYTPINTETVFHVVILFLVNLSTAYHLLLIQSLTMSEKDCVAVSSV